MARWRPALQLLALLGKLRHRPRAQALTAKQVARAFVADSARWLVLDEGTPTIGAQALAHTDITVRLGHHQLGYIQRLVVFPAQRRAQVPHFRTDSRLQRMGVGTAMARALRDVLKDRYPELDLIEFVSHPDHQEFYRALGARDTGRGHDGPGGHPLWEWRV